MSSRKHRGPVRTQPAAETGGKRARTRARLIAAAAELIGKDGIAAVSLDRIAAHAGVTKGAIYGNFEDKDDLIYAVAERFGRRPRPIFHADAPLDEQLNELAATFGATGRQPDTSLRLLTEIDLFVLTHEGARRRMFELAQVRYREAAANLAKIARRKQLPLPPLEFAIVVHALFNGLLFQRGIWPSMVTEEVARKALKAVAGQR
jgi:AcrR family transcriptional regulator